MNFNFAASLILLSPSSILGEQSQKGQKNVSNMANIYDEILRGVAGRPTETNTMT